MKQYIPEKMAAGSRYQKYFPTLDQSIQQEIYDRMGELITEEKEYCDQGNYSHMSQILTSIALYEVLQKHGMPEEEAYRTVSEEMWKFLNPAPMRKLAGMRFFLPLMKKRLSLSDSEKDPDTAGSMCGMMTIPKTCFISNVMIIVIRT